MLGKSTIDFKQKGNTPKTVYDDLNESFLIIYEKSEKIYGIWEPVASAQKAGTASANYFDLASDIDAATPVKALNPAVAFDGKNQYLVVWEAEWTDIYGPQAAIRGKWLANDIPCPPFNSFLVGYYEPYPKAKWQGAHNPAVQFDTKTKKFLAVWEDTRDYTTPSGDYAIYGSYVDLNTSSKSGKNFEIAPTAKVNKQRPKVGYDASNSVFLVTWDEHDIYGRFLNSKKTGKSFPIASAKKNQNISDLVFNGKTNNFFVVWSDMKNTFQADIYGHRIKF